MVLSNSTLQKLVYADLITDFTDSVQTLLVNLKEIDRITGEDELSKKLQSLKLIHKFYARRGKI